MWCTFLWLTLVLKNIPAPTELWENHQQLQPLCRSVQTDMVSVEMQKQCPWVTIGNPWLKWCLKNWKRCLKNWVKPMSKVIQICTYLSAEILVSVFEIYKTLNAFHKPPFPNSRLLLYFFSFIPGTWFPFQMHLLSNHLLLLKQNHHHVQGASWIYISL
jgi:hypothetical protein